jgi:hypothetical protein
MVMSLGMRPNQTSKNNSQEELRDLLASNVGPFTFGSVVKDPMVPDDPGRLIPTVSGAGSPTPFLPASAIASPA